MRFANKLFMMCFALLLSSSFVFAQGEGGLDLGEYLTDYRAVAAAIAIAFAAGLGAMGQGRAGAAALESIGRNPEANGKIRTSMIIILALIESLVILSFVVSLKLAGVW